MKTANRLALSGAVIELKALRHTPAGVPVVEFRLRHESEQPEAGTMRKVEVEIDAIAFEALARLLAQAAPGRRLAAAGFLAARSRRSKRPVLHVTDIEFE
ncbi:MAG: primosomal replication protein N [Burkholderiales bacterium]|nr:primosomal replication protein N [Burkholderiales bacterium]